jgi:hypothetical protein
MGEHPPERSLRESTPELPDIDRGIEKALFWKVVLGSEPLRGSRHERRGGVDEDCGGDPD